MLPPAAWIRVFLYPKMARPSRKLSSGLFLQSARGKPPSQNSTAFCPERNQMAESRNKYTPALITPAPGCFSLKPDKSAFGILQNRSETRSIGNADAENRAFNFRIVQRLNHFVQRSQRERIAVQNQPCRGFVLRAPNRFQKSAGRSEWFGFRHATDKDVLDRLRLKMFFDGLRQMAGGKNHAPDFLRAPDSGQPIQETACRSPAPSAWESPAANV